MIFLFKLKTVLTTPDYKVNKPKFWEDFGFAILFYFGIMILYIFALKFIDQWLGLPPHKSFEFFKQNSSELVLLMGIFIVPIIEELTFRLALKFSPLNASISFGLIIYFTISILSGSSVYKINRIFIVKIVIIIALSIIIYLILSKAKVSTSLQYVWKKYYTQIIFSFILVFALLHIRNLSFFSIKNLILIPMLILPQIILAVLASYFRITYGLFSGILLHSVVNSIPIIFWLILQ